jgi:hypothetical protein
MHYRHFTAARQPIAIIEEFDLEDDEQEPRITPIRADKNRRRFVLRKECATDGHRLTQIYDSYGMSLSVSIRVHLWQ